jgi:hypothetical protein
MMRDQWWVNRWRIIAVLALVGALVTPQSMLADMGMTSTHYRIPWSALNAGAQTMVSAEYQMQGSIAMGATGVTVSASYHVDAGFWPGLLTLPSHADDHNWRVWIPIVLRAW